MAHFLPNKVLQAVVFAYSIVFAVSSILLLFFNCCTYYFLINLFLSRMRNSMFVCVQRLALFRVQLQRCMCVRAVDFVAAYSPTHLEITSDWLARFLSAY